MPKNKHASEALSRRAFMGLSAAGLVGWVAGPSRGAGRFEPDPSQVVVTSEIRTNIDEALKIPRMATSMPGRYPGVVVKVDTGKTASGGRIDGRMAKRALDQGMMRLTGKSRAEDAWLEFVSPSDQIGIKVNPIARTLPTSRELTWAVIDGLQEAGVPRSQIAVWDRRLLDLSSGGFTKDRYPGIELLGTEVKGPNGEYANDRGEMWSLENIDREAPAYFADIEGNYSADSLPFMVNGGKYSYFSKLVTRRFTKIINLPVLKGGVLPCGISFALKNLAYGSLSNTSRLHRIGVNAIAEPCAFPCLRDKAVLNIGDALLATYRGGVGAPPRYMWDANVLLIGSDGVAVDLVAQEFLGDVRAAKGVENARDPNFRVYLDMAAALGLGVSDRAKIELREFSMV